MSSARDSGPLSVGVDIIWGALDWLRQLAWSTTPSGDTEGTELQDQTRNELLALAKGANIQGRHRMSKHELLAALASPGSHETPAGGIPSDAVGEASGAGARRAAEIPIPPEDLPVCYGSPRLMLLDVEPRRIHAYWEVAQEDCDAAEERLGANATSVTWVLRFHDVTCIDFDGTNAHSCFDVPVDRAAAGWYVEVWSADKSYCADIGPRASDGRFVPVCRSNFVSLPRSEPAQDYQPTWMNVEGRFEKVEQVASPPPEDRGSPDSTSSGLPGGGEHVVREGIEKTGGEGHGASVEGQGGVPPGQSGPQEAGTDPANINRAEMLQRYEQLFEGKRRSVSDHGNGAPDGAAPLFEGRSPSSEGVSSFGSGGSWDVAKVDGEAGIDLRLNADVVISGRAQPGQVVQLNGRWVKVNADGTFALRMALPVKGETEGPDT